MVTKQGFSRKFYKGFCAFLIFTLMLGMVPGTLFTNTANANGYSPFHDVSPSYWALPHIVKMESRGIILGTGGGIFQPENSVTQLQAITMAVRAMGLEKETHDTSKFVDTTRLNLPTTWNARGYVSVAARKGLINLENNSFQPNVAASRAWVAQLMVRMIGAENEIINTAITDFRDDSTIPVWAKPFVALAVKKELITGVAASGGGFNFLPNNPVKRSEFAALISRADRYLNDVTGQLSVAQITAIQGSTIEVVLANQSKQTLSTDSQTLFYDSRFQLTSLANLTGNEMVRYVIQNGKVLYLEVLNKDHYAPVKVVQYVDLSGTIVQHFSNDQLFTIRDSENQLHTKRYAPGIVIRGANNQAITFQDLKTGDNVTLKLLNDEIAQILVNTTTQAPVTPPANPTNQGVIYAIDLSQKLLTLQKNQQFITYTIDDQVRVFYPAVPFPTVRDLKVGDLIDIIVSSNVVTTITMVTPFQSNLVEGSIVAMNENEKIITVRTPNQSLHVYQTNDSTTFAIQGVSNPTFKDLQIGDQVNLTINGQLIQSIVVKNRSYTDQVIAEVVRVDQGLRLIILIDNKQMYHTYAIAQNAKIHINKANPTLGDIGVGELAVLHLDKNIVQAITIRDTIAGKLEAIQAGNTAVSILTEYGRETIRLSNQLQVFSAKKANATLADVSIGEQAVFHISRNQIHRIDLQQVIDTSVTAIDVANKRLTVTQGVSFFQNHTIHDGVIIDAPEYDNARFEHIQPNMNVRLYYTGFELKKIWLAPPDYGRVVNVDRTRNELFIQLGTTQKMIRMDSTLTVYSSTGERFSAYDLAVGNYVKIESSGSVTMVYRASTIQGEFSKINQASKTISFYNSGNVYNEMNLYFSPRVWKGAQWLTVNDLKADDKVTLYILDNRVVGIEVR